MGRLLLVLFACLIIFTDCTYNSEEDLYGTADCNTDSISYKNDIVPILEQNCIGCHSEAANFGNVNFETHTRLLIYVNNGELIGSIKHISGFSPMPENSPKMIQCNIAKIEKWVADGAPNN